MTDSVPTFDLAGRTVVVTGAGRGLGEATCHALAAAGAAVVVAEIDTTRGERVVADLTAAGAIASFERVDVGDPASVDALAASVGTPWGVVNNAGLADAVGGKYFWQIDVAEWDRIQQVNLRGVWMVARAFAPSMIDAGAGRIVNVASDAALYGSPRLSHYIASKGGVIALTRAMARELGDHGVTVNALAPGLTEGPSAVDIPAERHQLYADNRAISRSQKPHDMTGAAVFLLSDAGRYVTGQTLVVDGGFVMP